jgi:hypothetical protein
VIKLKTEEGHHEYLNHYGQPEARLMRTHSVGEKRGNIENSPAVIVAAVAMFCIPMMVLKRLRDIYVDGLVSGVDIKRLADDFSAQSKVQTTIVSTARAPKLGHLPLTLCQASIIMAVDASILAIPGLGSQVATKALCSVSFILGFYCIIGCTIAQQFCHRMRSLDFAVRFTYVFCNLDLMLLSG